MHVNVHDLSMAHMFQAQAVFQTSSLETPEICLSNSTTFVTRSGLLLRVIFRWSTIWSGSTIWIGSTIWSGSTILIGSTIGIGSTYLLCKGRFLIWSSLTVDFPPKPELSLKYNSSKHMIRFFLLMNKQGKTRLSKWYLPPPLEAERVRMEADIHKMIAVREKKHVYERIVKIYYFVLFFSSVMWSD